MSRDFFLLVCRFELFGTVHLRILDNALEGRTRHYFLFYFFTDYDLVLTDIFILLHSVIRQ
jgi:hypothetical protein